MATPEVPVDGAIIPDEEIIDLEQDVDEVVTDDLPTDPKELADLLVKERTARRQITARAKTAEGKLKTLKTATDPAPVVKEPKQDQQPSQTLIDVDERILISQGEDPEFLKELKEIATMKKVSLIEAKSSELGVAAKKIFDDKKKSKDAALGTSRGSGNKRPEKTLLTPGLSEEEHKKMAQDALK